MRRTLFTSSEEATSIPLIPLSIVDRLITADSDLEDVVRLVDHFGQKLNRQVSLLDVSHPDPAKACFLISGAYRTGVVGAGGFVCDIPNPLQRGQAIEDYFMARTMGIPLFSKIDGWMQDRSWRYDRLLAPIQNRKVNLLISAFWHSGEPEQSPRPAKARK
ncbi:MAG: hypothetical protein ACOVVK_24150 [Elsteraceae bacterium]